MHNANQAEARGSPRFPPSTVTRVRLPTVQPARLAHVLTPPPLFKSGLHEHEAQKRYSYIRYEGENIIT